MEALRAVAGPMLTSANFATSTGVAKSRQPEHHRLIRKQPTMASRVLPDAIANDVAIVPAVVAFAINAAIKSAGQTRYPRNKVTARAKPVGGHTGLALGFA